MALRNVNSFVKIIHNKPVFRTFGSGKVAYSNAESPVQITVEPSAPTSRGSSVKAVPDVPGLSTLVVDYGKAPVGPGASKETDYKNPEYFCYNTISYYQAEIEMAAYRCPQPSSVH